MKTPHKIVRDMISPNWEEVDYKEIAHKQGNADTVAVGQASEAARKMHWKGRATRWKRNEQVFGKDWRQGNQ
jgi:hypothetical protein